MTNRVCLAPKSGLWLTNLRSRADFSARQRVYHEAMVGHRPQG
jgi:hypothetical protein